MEEYTVIQIVAAALLPVLFAITLHEVAHGLAAKWLGDHTAAQLGRLSLNPLRHVDMVGTVVIPGLLLLMKTSFMFGWAKPVPVNVNRLRHPRRDMALVAIAGPAANLLMAIFWALCVRVSEILDIEFISAPVKLMGQIGISINAFFMLVNLLPIPPLDGGRIAVGLLPYSIAERYGRVEPYGFFILLLLMMTNILSVLLGFPMHLLQGLLYGLAGL